MLSEDSTVTGGTESVKYSACVAENDTEGLRENSVAHSKAGTATERGERSNACCASEFQGNSKRRGRKPKHTLETFKAELKKGEFLQDISSASEATVSVSEANATATANVVSYENKNKNENKKIQVRLETFHFRFSEELVERFTYFATLHRFDERKVYKENWVKWIAEEDVNACIAEEIERLTAEGYNGDILDKMFKSVRYYYRKKPFEPAPPKIRKTYESFPQDVLQSIDAHILDKIRDSRFSEETKSQGFQGLTESVAQVVRSQSSTTAKPALVSPAKAFADYKNKHSSVITVDVEAKYKKTYKNRFFLFTKHIRQL